MKRRVMVMGIGVCVAGAVVGVVAFLGARDPLRAEARRAWRDRAVARIERRVGDREWVAREVGRVRARAASRPAAGWRAWVGEEVLVMGNGEWVVCQNICRKEDARVHDLFLGRGSDGRWYYSTFHFCRNKVVLLDQRQPGSLAEFVEAYWLAPFDGRSDECLKETWRAGEAWGEEKVPAGGVAGK